MTGTSSLPRPGTGPGTTTPSWMFIDVSKTGAAFPIRNVAEQGGYSLFSLLLIPTRSRPRWWWAQRLLASRRFDDAMSSMMEADGGAALNNLRVRGGQRLSAFRSYVYPVMDRPNLTVLSFTGAGPNV